jgi:hypothetical protein
LKSQSDEYALSETNATFKASLLSKIPASKNYVFDKSNVRHPVPFSQLVL